MSVRRGSSLLEFMMTLPFAVLLLFITMDTGKAVFVKTGMQSAASTAAASGARGGAIEYDIFTECDKVSTKIFKSFCSAANWESMGVTITNITVRMVNYEGGESDFKYCTVNHPYVEVRAEGNLENMLTPSVNFVERLAFLTTVKVQSTAYCEVYRE